MVEVENEVRELHFQRGSLNFSVGPQPREQGPSDRDASEYFFNAIFAFLFLNLHFCFINDQI